MLIVPAFLRSWAKSRKSYQLGVGDESSPGKGQRAHRRQPRDSLSCGIKSKSLGVGDGSSPGRGPRAHQSLPDVLFGPVKPKKFQGGVGDESSPG